MSILLEALRKSEKGQHTREVPTIYTDHHSGQVSESIRTGPLALLLVAALFITGWFVWRQYQPPLVDSGIPVTSAEIPAVDTQKPAVEKQPPVAGSGTPATKSDLTVADGSSATATSSKPVAPVGGAATTPVAAGKAGKQASTSSPVPQQRTPMESYQRPADSVAKAKSTEAKSTEAKPNKAKPNRAKPDKAKPTKAKSAGAKKPGNARAPAQTGDSGTGKPVKPATETRKPEEPAPISYWELPDAVRADLPEIKFSVLVYASNPADRFVLVNGERLREGDSPQAGLKVKEIRRDGVIFRYRAYQFLVEK